MLDMVSTAN